MSSQSISQLTVLQLGVSKVPAVDVLAVATATGNTILLVTNKLDVAAPIRTSLQGDVDSVVCDVEVFAQPPLSWNTWPLNIVDSLWLKNPPGVGNGTSEVNVPALSIAILYLC